MCSCVLFASDLISHHPDFCFTLQNIHAQLLYQHQSFSLGDIQDRQSQQLCCRRKVDIKIV